MIEHDRHFRLFFSDVFGNFRNFIMLADRFFHDLILLFGNHKFLALVSKFFKALRGRLTYLALKATVVLVNKHARVKLSVIFELKSESPINH